MISSIRRRLLHAKKPKQVVTVKRPAVPHLHLVNLRPEEKIIDKVLFDGAKPATQMVKTLTVAR